MIINSSPFSNRLTLYCRILVRDLFSHWSWDVLEHKSTRILCIHTRTTHSRALFPFNRNDFYSDGTRVWRGTFVLCVYLSIDRPKTNSDQIFSPPTKTMPPPVSIVFPVSNMYFTIIDRSIDSFFRRSWPFCYRPPHTRPCVSRAGRSIKRNRVDETKIASAEGCWYARGPNGIM